MAQQSKTTFIGQIDFSGTTHAGVRLNNLTTTQRDALTASNGMLIYNTTTTTVQKYENGTWADVTSGGSGGAPTTASYVTLGTDATLTSERVLTGTANQVVVTDGGAGTTVTLSTPQDIATASSPTFAGLTLNGNVSVIGTSAWSLSQGRATTGAGNNTTVSAGGAQSTATDTVGGDLLLSSGISTGTARSKIQLQVPTGGTTSNTDKSPATAAVLFSPSSSLPVFSIGNVGGSTTGLPVTSNVYALNGAGAGGVVMYRHTTTNTAGNNMTVQASSATSAATDKAGGTLILSPGASTGTGRSLLSLKGYTVATATATADNTQLDRHVVGAFKALTNNTATALVNATAASNTVVGGIIRYAIEVFNGTDLQMETGEVTYQCANKAGIFSGNTVTQIGTAKQFLGTGTLAVTWTITGANPAVLSVNANSSLTPSAGYPRITYTIENLTQQAIAIQ